MNRNEQAIYQFAVNVARRTANNEWDIIALQRECKGKDREAVKALLMRGYAHGAGVTLYVQGSGRLVWPAANIDPRVKSVKNAFNALLERILGKAAGHDKAVVRPRVVTRVATEAAAVVKAAELSKAEVAAVIAELRKLLK